MSILVLIGGSDDIQNSRLVNLFINIKHCI